MKASITISLVLYVLLFFCHSCSGYKCLFFKHTKFLSKQTKLFGDDAGGDFERKSNSILEVPQQTFINTPANERKLPTDKELLVFGLPTLAVGLLQPVLSLIDTSVVGICKSSTVTQLAALGPGIAWIDSSSYLFYFMAIATNSLYVTALSNGNEQYSREVISHALVLSFVIGLGLFFIQYFFAHNMISFFAGIATDTIPYGVTYAKG